MCSWIMRQPLQAATPKLARPPPRRAPKMVQCCRLLHHRITCCLRLRHSSRAGSGRHSNSSSSSRNSSSNGTRHCRRRYYRSRSRSSNRIPSSWWVSNSSNFPIVLPCKCTRRQECHFRSRKCSCAVIADHGWCFRLGRSAQVAGRTAHLCSQLQHRVYAPASIRRSHRSRACSSAALRPQPRPRLGTRRAFEDNDHSVPRGEHLLSNLPAVASVCTMHLPLPARLCDLGVEKVINWFNMSTRNSQLVTVTSITR